MLPRTWIVGISVFLFLSFAFALALIFFLAIFGLSTVLVFPTVIVQKISSITRRSRLWIAWVLFLILLLLALRLACRLFLASSLTISIVLVIIRLLALISRCLFIGG